MTWRILSVTSLAVVLLEVGMAVMISYSTPTVGISCRSGFSLIYGFSSTLTWVLQHLPFFKRPGIKRKALCHAVNLLSSLSLLVIIFAAVSEPSALDDFLHFSCNRSAEHGTRT
jgi:hypothetical protein